MADSLVKKKSVCVITGPTRGLGRCIAQHLSAQLPKGSLFILLSRNQILLDNIAEVVSKNQGIKAVTAHFDQGQVCKVKGQQSPTDNDGNVLNTCLQKADAVASDFEQAILINNAGSLDLLEMMRDLDSFNDISSYFDVNVTGCMVLTSQFLQTFKTPDVKSRLMINISSLAATTPMKSWSLYCMAKAARDMMMKVVGEEEVHIRTLNYAPGPLLTDMTDIACKHTKDLELRTWFEDQVRNKSFVECDDSVRKLIMILTKNTFQNGAHIDYYDEI